MSFATLGISRRILQSLYNKRTAFELLIIQEAKIRMGKIKKKLRPL